MNTLSASQPSGSEWLRWPLGQRVVVRRKLPTGSSHLYTDVKGFVVDTNDNGVTLQTLTELVTIPGDEIALGKLIPPRPPKRRPRTDQ